MTPCGAAGYQVTSVSGNDNAMGLDGAVIAGANLIVVGFSAEHSVRAAMVLWMRLCVEAADGQDSKRLLELISEIDCLLHEREMRIRNVRREASRYVIEAAEKKAS